MKTPQQLRDLADAIEAHERGEPVQYMHIGLGGTQWHMDTDTPAFQSESFLFRPLPKPVTRPWSKPEHLPFDFRIRNRDNPVAVYFPTGIFKDGIAVTFKGEGYFYNWLALEQWDHTTDGKTWSACVVTEPAP